MTTAESHTRTNTSELNEGEYTKFIIDSLAKGVQPVYVSGNAGQFAPLIDILLDDYNPDALDEFTFALDALKIKHEAFRIALETNTKDVPPNDADFVTEPGGKRAFKEYSLRDVLSLPDIDWLVSGILQRSTTTLVVGSGNVGKTFVWLDVCLNIAYGDKWLNRKTRQGRVLYIYAEGSGGLKQRIKAWLTDHGKSLTDLTDQITFIPRPVNLLTNQVELLNTIEKSVKIYGQAPEELVIDTFSMCAGGVDENSNSQVAQYLETASMIKLKYGCHVTIIHHVNKNGSYRGASALRDNVDTMIMLDKDTKEGPIKVTCEKQRDGEFFPTFYLKLKVVELGINTYTLEPITSCVVTLATDDEEEDGNTPVMSEKWQKMLQILSIHGSLTSGAWQKRCEEEADIDKNAFNYAVRKMLDKGYITAEEYNYGKQKRVSYALPKSEEN